MSSHAGWSRQICAGWGVVCLASVLVSAEPASERSRPLSIQELKALSLEQLLNQEVSLVSRRPEKLLEAPSAIQVIPSEAIHRSGALTLAEALRLAPNLQVSRQNAHDWAITSRGFNAAPLASGSLANKLLVMIDGRSVYTPLFGGVFWDVQHVLLEDVSRIEVVSGPGGSLWGANAVNGVINVVTKSAQETQGTYLSGAAGTFLQNFGAARHGGQLASNLFYRIHAQRFDHGHTRHRDGENNRDDWNLAQGGFRLDYLPSPADSYTFQGDFLGGELGRPNSARVDGQNLLGRWTRRFSEESELSAQLYWDRTWRRLPDPNFAHELNTCDFDFQHRFPVAERHSILWGAEYRVIEDDTRNSIPLSFFPAQRSMQLFSGFLQDEISLVPGRLNLTLGSKLEHNDFSGFEIQPSARLAFRVTGGHTAWAAVSRAVRAPSRFDADEATPFLITPNQSFSSERVLAWELGYRVQPADRFTLSIAGFYNRYEDLRSINYNPSPPPALVFSNDQEAETWGMELSAAAQVTDHWRLRGGYTGLAQKIRATSSEVFPGSDAFEANDPAHQFVLQSMLDLPFGFQFDGVARYVDSLKGASETSPSVPAYFSLDLRLAWQYKEVEISVAGQNLLEERHSEFGSLEIPRSVYGRVIWRF